ncbi:MAG: ABC transporter permease, partial [Candidatus Liptonbacteria bacterium]
MNLTRVYAIFIRQFYLLRDNPTRLFQMLVWGTVDIILWGFTSRYLTSIAPGFKFALVFLGAVLIWDFLSRIMQGITMSFMEDTWTRNLLNIFASPISISEYMSGLIATSILKSVASFGVLLLVASAAFGFSAFSYGFSILAFLLILFLSGIALGILGTSIMLRWGPIAEWFIWPIPALMSPFVGVLYPASTLPHWMQQVGQFLPPSYVFDGLRSIVAGGEFHLGSFAIGIALAIFYIFIAYLIFLRVYRRAVRT